MPSPHLTTAVLSTLLLLAACGDDGRIAPDTSPGSDTGIGDGGDIDTGTGTDGGTDTGTGTDGGTDGGTDSGTKCPDDDMDGVCNDEDICAAGDDGVDTDSDGVPDACDICADGDDTVDADSDGVPDACDVCADGDDTVDADSDTVPDACDVCAAGDDTVDADADGVPDACDICAAGDDSMDADSDGVPNACDTCATGDDMLDADSDGVADACDMCPGFDDTTDTDMDGTPDGCDICPIGDDAAEDDDDVSTAQPLAYDTPINNVTCGDDEDFFALPVTGGCGATVTVEFTDADGDIDVTLRNSAGTTLDSSLSVTDNETVTAAASADDTWYIRVHNLTSTGGPRYTITATDNYCYSCPADDPREDLDDDPATAPPGPSLGVAGRGRICGGDSDYYPVTALAGCTIDSELLFTDADGDLDLELVNASGAVLAASGSVTDDESLSHVLASSGTFYLRVFGFPAATAENHYQITTDVSCASACVADDVYEDNDARASATSISAGTVYSAAICGSDDDWYSIGARAGCELTVDLLFTDDFGDVDVRLFDASDTQVDSSASASDNEQVSDTPTSDGTYTVEVYGFAGAQNAYQLIADLDGTDDNETAATATPLTAGAPAVPGRTCDDDWYSIDVPATCAVTLDVSFSDAAGDIDLRLEDSSGAFLDSSVTSSNNEQVSWSNTRGATETVNLRVYGFLGAVNDYTVQANIACP